MRLPRLRDTGAEWNGLGLPLFGARCRLADGTFAAAGRDAVALGQTKKVSKRTCKPGSVSRRLRGGGDHFSGAAIARRL